MAFKVDVAAVTDGAGVGGDAGALVAAGIAPGARVNAAQTDTLESKRGSSSFILSKSQYSETLDCTRCTPMSFPDKIALIFYLLLATARKEKSSSGLS